MIMRKDYSGFEVNSSYVGAFEGGGTERRMDFGMGFGFGSGTNVNISGSYRKSEALRVKDTFFMRRVRDYIDSSIPDYYTNQMFPPLGGTTNIRSVSGGNLRLRPDYGGQSLGSSIAHVPRGYPGVETDSPVTLLLGAGSYDLSSPSGVQEGGGDRSLMAESTVKSVSASVRHGFFDGFDGFVDGFFSENTTNQYMSSLSGQFTIPAGVPGNPFDQAVRVRVPITDFRGAIHSPYRTNRLVVGAIFDLGSGWGVVMDHAREEGEFSKVIPSSSLIPRASVDVNSGQLDVFRDVSRYPIGISGYVSDPVVSPYAKTVLGVSSVRASGPLPISLPGGKVNVTALLEYKDEKFGDNTILLNEFTALTYFKRSQNVRSAYLETRLPLVSDRNDIPMVRELEAQIAARWDDYSLSGANFGISPEQLVRVRRGLESIDPTVALRWVPVQDVVFRASFGSGFMPPNLAQLVPSEPYFVSGDIYGVVDPKRGGEGVGEVLLYGGGNPFLDPEISESFSAGVVISGAYLFGARLSVDWVRIEKKDNITTLSLNQEYIDDEGAIPGLISRAPDDGLGFEVGPIISYQSGYLNVARNRVEALDGSLSYLLESESLGSFDLSVSATRNIENIEQVTRMASPRDRVGLRSILKWKVSSYVGWSRDNVSMGWSANYFDSYCPGACELLGAGNFLYNKKIESQFYHDIFMKYNIPKLGSGGYVKIGIDNVTNEIPPLSLASFPYYSTYGDPRLRRYSLSFGLSF